MIASSAEDIQLWDIRLQTEQQEAKNSVLPLEAVKRWTPIVSGPNWNQITDLAWSHSANTISCAASKFGEIVFCSIEHAGDGDRPQCKKGIVGHRCVDIGEKDRLLVTAGQDSNLYLYSMTRCKLWQIFKGHNGSITAAVFNSTSSHIASGSDKGEIILSNIATKESTAPLLAPRVQVINKLCYNPFKTSILGAVSSDGAVNIWDAGRAKLLQSANQIHTASATSLSFFTDNSQLLATVGLDGKLALFDTTNLSMVSLTSVKSGITCVDVGGDVIALGTKQGDIYLYDHRNMKTPFIHKQAAHKSAVNSIKFRKREEQLSLLSQSLGNLSGSGLTSSSKSTLDRPGSDLELSPLRDNNIGINFEENGLFSPPSHHNSICHSENSLNQSGLAHLSDNSLMWPSMPSIMQSCNFDTNLSLLEQSNANYGHFTDEEKLNCTSNVGSRQEVRNGTSVRFNVPNAGLPPCITESYNSPKSIQQLPKSPEGITVQNSKDHISVRPHVPISPQTSEMVASMPIEPAANDYLQRSQSATSPKLTGDSCSKSTLEKKSPSSLEATQNSNLRTSQMQIYPNSSTSNAVGNGLSSTLTPSNAFSFKLMHSVVQDAMEEFTDQIHNDFLCMQMNILRMFQQQQAELRYDLQQQLSIVKDLVAENQQLKQENKQLRKNY